MNQNLFPLFENFGTHSYLNVFISTSIIFTITATFAVYYNSLTKKRLNKTNFCISKHNIFCRITLNPYLNILNLCIRTFTSTIILYIFLFLLFGWGGGSLHNFYKPNNKDFKLCFLLILCIVIINFLIYYLMIYYSLKKMKINKKPSISLTSYYILLLYGFKNKLHYNKGKFKYLNKGYINNKKKTDTLINMEGQEKINYFNKLDLLEKARILHIIPAKERVKLLKKLDENQKILYLSLLSPEQKSETLSYM